MRCAGYKGVEVDTQKDLVIVSGAVDVEALADELRKHLKKDMAIVPSKKDNGGGDGKGNNVQGNDMHHPHPYWNQHPNPYAYPYESGPFQYNPYGAHLHAPQIFSDDNPNACTIM